MTKEEREERCKKCRHYNSYGNLLMGFCGNKDCYQNQYEDECVSFKDRETYINELKETLNKYGIKY